jgi:hypothetical protein
MLGSGQADGVMADARDTLKAFKQVADTLNARLAPSPTIWRGFRGSP